jgi:hypothetical protein
MASAERRAFAEIARLLSIRKMELNGSGMVSGCSNRRVVD